MNIFFHDAKSEVNFLLGYYGYTVQITRVPGLAGDPFDAVIEDANTGDDSVELVYLPFDDETGHAVEGAEPESIRTDEIHELAIY